MPKLLDVPVREELRAGLTRTSLLPSGSAYLQFDAGANHLWSGQTNAFVRAEAGKHLTDSTSVFGYAQADLQGVQGGLGLRVDLP